METTTPTRLTQDTFEAFLETRREPDWLIAARREAWDVYQSLSWPSRQDEEWARTDIRTFKLDQFAVPLDSSGPAELPASLLSAGVELGGQIVAANGQLESTMLDDRWQRQGVLLGDLSQLLSEHGDRLAPYVRRQLLPAGLDRFAALRSAFWTTAPVLYVPRGVVVDQPIHAFSVLGSGGTDFSHALVILDEGAEATILCETAGTSVAADGLHAGALELWQQAGSHLRVVNLQNWGMNTWHFAHHKAVLERDSTLQWTIAAIGSRLAKVNQHVELRGSGASCQVNGVMFTEGKQHISYSTLQHHVAPHCHSDFLYKGALQDKSRTVWRGMIKVDPAAQQTDGYQRNDNLLLSSTVRADSIPGLEIEADDVRCTHGSTSGRVDEELIFYAQCRGFTRREAIRAIVTGFFQQVFDRITIDSVREALALAIGRRVREYT